ncbi:MAG: mechanosensitive ion channel [Nitrospirae bacterium]|nr:mechanosensitive ion channel [Nitrospirota bacterium]
MVTSWLQWNPFILPLLVFLGGLVAALLIRKLLLVALTRWATKTATRVDDLVLATLRLPSLLWGVVLALYLAIGLSSLDPNSVFYAFRILHAVLILSVTWTAANLAALLLRGVVDRLSLEIPITGLTVGILKGTILTVGLLIFLSSQGIAITPILTALGIGGLAVALGLQETLANLFAGLHLLIEKPIRPGDFIKLESGEEGQVVDIGWRSTRIRMRPNNLIIIPNSKLAQSRIVNYYYPEKLMAVPIRVSVGYGADPDRIERILVEEALSAANAVPGLLKEPSPNVQLIPGFGDSSLDFTLTVHVAEYNDQFPAQHEIRKRILARFRREGITIPYPQQVVHLHPQPGPSPKA